MKEKKQIAFIDSTILHIIAMALMLSDHIWGTIAVGKNWMTYLGRLAFPIFAFMIVEGFYHTKNVKKYLLRLLVGAIISEIPFNLMMSGEIIDPFDQNVMWTFIIGLLCILISEKVRSTKKMLWIPTMIIVFLVGYFIGFITMVDYQGYGVITVGLFYAFYGTGWWKKCFIAAGLIYINAFLFKGMCIDISFFGHTFEVVSQSFAAFAIIPILLYNGKKGCGSKAFQIFCYLFYPAHILILSLIALYLI